MKTTRTKDLTRRDFLVTTAAAGTAFYLPRILSAAPTGKQAFTILHTNDFHARFEPINGFDSACSPEDAAEAKRAQGDATTITVIAR